MGTVEGGVGNLVGTERPFHHGGLQPKKMRSGFLKRRAISSVKS
jgi:hypothetical protein